MASKSKWYVVWAGNEPGVYPSWEECQQATRGYRGAKFKAFPTQSDALRAYEDGYEVYKKNNPTSPQQQRPIQRALSVDAACSGNPGVMEYRGVMVDSRREVFRIGPFPVGTNNIGEFLALVHGLSLLKKHNLTIPLYSDSVTAMAWVRNKHCKTLLPRNEQTAQLLDLVRRAEDWLRSNSYTTAIYKWDTQSWGEIPADFGRK